MKKTQPDVPLLGSSPEAVKALYPDLRKVRTRAAFRGRVFVLDKGPHLFHFIFDDKGLFEAIFNTDWLRRSKRDRKKKLEYFLRSVGGRRQFVLALDNGFGFTFERKDKKVFALYSYAADVVTLGRMVRGRINLPRWEASNVA